ncbi:ribulose-1,5 bisphosphate carboxylase/oxygenase large subunit N-methyltransferase, chloroplastic isoform X2 [Neltuma alba]|uniref:ribulose-1,5 bisphosphate carboxylase/oxygenase large subunit N-methyltransferase, chloroplastic isoform X2 n=1 Tax=Neltuma alba TaxID=207710 RepID=UPI0010A446A7|nr:ribulose-1,5 bisphosphate carboxylase/oxygenase large subunit N-methyltransferase, chloroplastic isoform X2 [Prosopis alba]
MLLRLRIPAFWWSLCSLSNARRYPHPSSSFQLSLSSSSHPQVSGILDGDCDGFLPWLERKAVSKISSALSIGKAPCGRALFASRIIHTGECILQVPYAVQMTVDNLLPEIRSLISTEVGCISKLAVVILVEQKLGRDSEWDPYISCLPQQGQLHNTIFWSESELDMIRLSSVYQETINQKSQIEKDFLAIRPVFKSLLKSFGEFTFKDFMHACTLVGSRAWGSMKGLSLIPFADFLNHDGDSDSIVMSDDDKQYSEVLIRYGKFSNATLMLDFGFTLPYNNYDEVQIQLDIPKHDPLRDLKMELLRQYFVRPNKDVKGLSNSVNSFIIKEVTSAKGKGLPQSLRAFARVLSCTFPQELDDLAMEAAQTDGRLARRPLRNISKEIEAHLLLSSLFNKLIAEHSEAILSLELSNAPSLSTKLAVRRKMARDLLVGELRILKSASAWLDNYCSSLTGRSIHC